jgi:hypothetical protein
VPTITPTPAPRHVLKIQPVLPTEGSISISPPADAGDSYTEGTVIVIRALATRGCGFTGWSGSITSSEPAIKFEITADTALEASFRCLVIISPPLLKTTATATPGRIILPTFAVPEIKLLTPVVSGF